MIQLQLTTENFLIQRKQSKIETILEKCANNFSNKFQYSIKKSLKIL